jgi:hypothetical protein
MWEPFFIFSFVEDGSLNAITETIDNSNIMAARLFFLRSELTFILYD